jgi:hypothetical protein
MAARKAAIQAQQLAAAKRPWWQKAWVGAGNLAHNTVDWVGRNAGTIGLVAGGIALGVALMSNPAGWLVMAGSVAAYVDVGMAMAGAVYAGSKGNYAQAGVNLLGVIPGVGAITLVKRTKRAAAAVRKASKMPGGMGASGNPAKRAAAPAASQAAKAVLAGRRGTLVGWQKGTYVAYAGQLEIFLGGMLTEKN